MATLDTISRPSKIGAARQEFKTDHLLFVGLMFALAICPFWFGGNRLPAWGVHAIIFPALVIVFEVSLLVQGRPHPVPISQFKWSAIGIGLVVAWIIVQASTLTPAGWHYAIWSMAKSELRAPIEGSISVNRDLTTLALIRLVTTLAAFWLTLQLCRDPLRARRFLQVLCLIGAFYAAYGTISFVLFPDWFLWFPKAPSPEQSVTSTFANRNHFATYAGIILIACIGSAMNEYRRAMNYAGRSTLGKLGSIAGFVAGRGGKLLVATFVVAVALSLTGSRAGILAGMIGALSLVMLIISNRAANKTSTAMIAIAVVLLIVALFFFGDVFAQRLAGFDLEATGRMAVYKLTLRSILDNPWLGFGYGTFDDVFPLYRDATVNIVGRWDKAHCIYLELLQGLGIPAALVLFASFGLIIAVITRAALAGGRGSTCCLVAAASSAIVMLHSTVDFSLQIQAVALTWAAVLGAGVAQSVELSSQKRDR